MITMSKRKGSRAEAARRGTAADASDRNLAAAQASGAVSPTRPRQRGARARLTDRIFITLEVVLAVVPLAVVAGMWMRQGGSSVGFDEMLRRDPHLLVAFLGAMLQPFVAWLVRIAKKHYDEGDGGFAVANLIALLCCEIAVQNMVGIVGLALGLWRIWREASGELGTWAGARKVPGVLADLSGSLVVAVLAAICAFAMMRVA